MGTYNPNAPTILGQEWVPIREEDQVFTPAANAVEVGSGFTLAQSRTLQDARFYLNTFPPGASFGQTFFTSVYPRGKEDLSGPVQRIVIPCNNAGITGADIGVLNAGTAVAALADPSDISAIDWTPGGSPPTWQIAGRIKMFFNVEAYATQLAGKRILGVNFLYAMGGAIKVWQATDADQSNVYVENNAGDQMNYGAIYGTESNEGMSFFSSSGLDGVTKNAVLSVARLGEVNHFWSTTLSPTLTADRVPFTLPGLLQFSAASANRIGVMIRVSSAVDTDADGNPDLTGSDFWLNYAGLEVVYCDEQRLAVAGKSFGMDGFFAQHRVYTMGANIATMRGLDTSANPILPAGDYTVALSSADVGDLRRLTTAFFISARDATPIGPSYPKLNAVRELYALPPHPGVQINRPFPVDESIVGRVFTQETTHVIPQISLHASGGPLTEVHVYGRQAAAQVYGTITATQEIFDPGATPQALYPQVRFYARRWGDTTVALTLDSTSPTVSGSSVSITPGEFDALLPANGIIDGWKEVTLRFITAPVMGVSGTGGFYPQWRWSATGELSGNRWEVLGAIAPAISGNPANPVQLVPAPHQLGIATYGAPVSGAGINLAWIPGYAPLVSSTTDDPSSDATILFSQDPPPISGFAVTQETQTLTVADPNCPGFASGCVPTSMTYNRLTWTAQGLAMFDDFERFESNGWGSADPGGPWTVVSGSAANFSVNGNTGLMNLPSVNVEQWIQSASVGGPDVDLKMRVATSQLALTQPINIYLVARYVDLNNFYRCRLSFDVAGTLSLRFEKGVAGVFTSLGVLTPQPGVTHTTNTYYWFRFNITGNTLSAKVWQANTVEPSAWTIQLVDTDLTGPGTVGVRGILSTGNTNTLPVVMSINDFSSNLGYGSTELQRFDQVDGEFKTIMLSGSPATSGFSDYEARVGQQSVYRIRGVNIYDFAGLWSPQVTGTIPSPGVAGADTALLLFSSNEDPTKNLAYSSAWDSGDPQEDFQWPEAGDVILQEVYGKDFVTAFRPTERGGERFTRNILVNAAGIPAVTSANGFESLRDMAWADLPYVCVRDELGNRWYSTVLVPQGNRKRMKRAGHLDMASVSIIETTSTPSPVDPI